MSSQREAVETGRLRGEVKALDWIEYLLHRRDFIPATLDLLHLPRKRLSHTTRQKEGDCHLLARISRSLMMEMRVTCIF